MKFDDYIKEISIGSKFKLSKVVVIGPYPTKDFFDQVLNYAPAQLVLLVDDGWPEDRLDEIRDLCTAKKCRLPKIQRVSPSENRNGLVHAKLYYFEWKNVQGNYTRRILLAGSANASIQGFGIHAETFVNIDFADLSREDCNAAMKYLEALERGEKVDREWLSIGQNKSWISLPALRVVDKKLINGFDSWLRRGKLCHQYQPDQTFGRLILHLKKPMPKSAMEKNFQKLNFVKSGDPKEFSRKYISFENEKPERQTWRQAFFVETDYGFWTSGECFAQLSKEFVTSNKDQRIQVIEQVCNAKDQLLWLGDFIKSVEEAASGLGDTKQLVDYFELLSDGKLNIESYKKKAEKKLSDDRQKAKDKYFSDRFKSGFVFSPMPQFGDEFENFAISFCENLLAKMQGRKTNMLARILYEEIEELPESGKELYSYLRSKWDAHRQEIVMFHED